MTLGKIGEVVGQLEEMAEEAKKAWLKTACEMALSESATRAIGNMTEFDDIHNHLLAKAIVDAWCLKRPYSALTDEHREDFEIVRQLVVIQAIEGGEHSNG